MVVRAVSCDFVDRSLSERKKHETKPGHHLIQRALCIATHSPLSLHALTSAIGWPKPSKGAVAQLGERMNGIHEVRGSIPLGSTKFYFHRVPQRKSFLINPD